MKFLIGLLFFIPLTLSANDFKPDFHVFPVELIKVVDGDTMDVRIDLSLGLFKDVRIRIKDFDAPETWRPKTQVERLHGEQATLRTIELLEKDFWVRVYGWGVFNRVRADIILNDGRDFATIMIEEGFEKRSSYE